MKVSEEGTLRAKENSKKLTLKDFGFSIMEKDMCKYFK